MQQKATLTKPADALLRIAAAAEAPTAKEIVTHSYYTQNDSCAV
jgi:hypothetical protein